MSIRVPKRIRVFLILLLMVVGFVVFCIWQNNNIVVTDVEYSNNKVPDSFEGYTIVQISDLHNKNFGGSQSQLLNKVGRANPDIIVITGDLIDSRRTNMDIAMEFVNGAVEIAPVYYVSGNHEARSGIYPELAQKLTEAGVILLDDHKLQVEREGSSIELLGVSDPAFTLSDYSENSSSAQLAERLNGLVESDKQSFKVLLSHRPELLDIYASNHIDLVFTGHAHGGQFRIPFVGGLVAPNQGVFPKYTSGTHEMGNTTMVVSRGIGNSIIPVRIFNRPEVVVVTLHTE